MPEGDTIYRTARQLGEVLRGAEIQSAVSPNGMLDPALLNGRSVVSLESRGKHLLLHLDNELSIHSHMGMTGSWHVYGLSDSWRKPERQAALVLNVASALCVCFSPKTLELLTPLGLRGHRYLSKLGPDLLSDSFEMDTAIQRFRTSDAVPIGESIMHQSIVCGIGNVYKSEILFLRKLDPFAATGKLSEDELERLLNEARRMMKRNLTGYPRRTRFGRDGRRLWVYGRRGEPCLECGGTILMRRQGDLGRSTYWCPSCQQ